MERSKSVSKPLKTFKRWNNSRASTDVLPKKIKTTRMLTSSQSYVDIGMGGTPRPSATTRRPKSSLKRNETQELFSQTTFLDTEHRKFIVQPDPPESGKPGDLLSQNVNSYLDFCHE
jgi:hypothetical protein